MSDSFEKYYFFNSLEESNENSINNSGYEESLNFDNEENYKKNNIFPILQEEKSTGFKTNIKELYHNIMTKMNEDNKEDCPPFYSMEQILKKTDEIISDPEIKKQLINKKEFIENSQNYAYMQLTKKKRKREEEEDIIPKRYTDLYIVLKNENKRGRKTEKNKRHFIHDKNKSDNIIKKIKAKLFKFALTFANSILNLNEENKLLKLDYDKYINKLKREVDLNLLKMPLKDFLSLDISKKYNKESFYNKSIIDNILNKQENIIVYDNKTNKTINFILDITFEDYIDICIFKKSLDDLIKEYGYKTEYIDCNKIKSNLNIINSISSEIIQKNDITYFSFFLLYLYNYKRWFYLKKGRQISSNEKNMEKLVQNYLK